MGAAAQRRSGARCFEVLLEVGIPGKRTGSRTLEAALSLARALFASPMFRLDGVERYEGWLANCDSDHDIAAVTALVRRVTAVVRACNAENLFEDEQVLITVGGSSVFDLVIPLLTIKDSQKPVRGVLRSGCYLTHDTAAINVF